MSEDHWASPADGRDGSPSSSSIGTLSQITLWLVAQQKLAISCQVALAIWTIGAQVVEPLVGFVPPDHPAYTARVVLGVSATALTLLGLPLWIRWHWLAASEVRQRTGPMENAPAAHVVWWFVPFANLFMPFRAMRELVKRATQHQEGGPHTSTLWLWWCAWLAEILSTYAQFVELMRPWWPWVDLAVAASTIATMAAYIGLIRIVQQGLSADLRKQ